MGLAWVWHGRLPRMFLHQRVGERGRGRGRRLLGELGACVLLFTFLIPLLGRLGPGDTYFF